MQFLEICQKLAADRDLPGALTTVGGQTGEFLAVVRDASQAYVEIQNRHLGMWRWLRRPFTFNTVSNDDTYVYGDVTDVDAAGVITRFKRWYVNDEYCPAQLYRQSTGVGGETWLTYIEWESFKALYRFGTQTASQPIHISVDPQRRLVLGPKPNDVYVVSGEFFRGAQVLANDDHVPEMPDDYHYLIAYDALLKFGFKQARREAIAYAETEGRRLKRQLDNDQGPQIRIMGVQY